MNLLGHFARVRYQTVHLSQLYISQVNESALLKYIVTLEIQLNQILKIIAIIDNYIDDILTVKIILISYSMHEFDKQF